MATLTTTPQHYLVKVNIVSNMTQLPISFYIQTEPDGRLHMSEVPDEPKTVQAIAENLVKRLPFGPAWEAQYRALWLLSQPDDHPPVSTVQQLAQIAVPHYRRMQVYWDGQQVSWQEPELSFDNETWQSLPTLSESAKTLELIARHPAFELQGESVGVFQSEHWQAGRIDLDPEPPENLLDLLEEVLAIWHGRNADDWLNTHRNWSADDNAIAPQAKRSTIEVRQLSPLLPPFVLWYGGLTFQVLEDSQYSLDGEEWLDYLPQSSELSSDENSKDDAEEEADPFSIFSELLNISTQEVYVCHDGRLKWQPASNGEELGTEQQQQLQKLVLERSGAGSPDWYERASALVALVEDELELEAGEDNDTKNASANNVESEQDQHSNAPEALRLTLLPDLLSVPELEEGLIAKVGRLSLAEFEASSDVSNNAKAPNSHPDQAN